jgi:3-oxoadipate enol-lactonase
VFIEFRGHKVHAVGYGRGDPPIVGISGAIGTSEIWEPPFELLSGRHRVISYDHLGAGLTRVPAHEVTFANQVQLLGALLDSFGIERCVLVGDSNMVAVAVEAALRWPQRIESLALVSGGVVHQRDDLVARFVDGLRTNFDATVGAFVELCIPEVDAAHLRAWLRDIIARTGGERAATLIESFYGVDLSDRLAAVTQPTVVIHGENDRLPASTVSAAQQIAGAIPDCRLEVLGGVGHVPTLTRPMEVAALIGQLADGGCGSRVP